MKTRAAIDPITLTVIAVVAIAAALMSPSGGPGKKHFWEFWKKDPVQQVQQATAAIDAAKAKADADAAVAAAKVEAEKAKQLAVGHEASVATGQAIAAAQAVAATGKLPVKELDTAQSINATGTQALDQALGSVSPARVRELEAMVSNLNAGLAGGATALKLMQETLDRTVADKADALAKLVQVEAEGKAAVTAAEAIRTAAEKKEQAWALERDGLAREFERLTFWGKIGGAVFAIVALYVAFLLWRTGQLGNFAKDAVGMSEMLKGELQKHATPEAFAAVKTAIDTDWMTAHDGTAAILAKIKSQLRL